MTALRELAERWKRRASLSDGKGDLAFANNKCAAELLSILDAEGDGGAAPLPVELMKWLDSRDLVPDLDEDGSFDISALVEALNEHERQIAHPQPGRSGVVSDEVVSDIAKMIADRVGNGMREKYEALAKQIVEHFAKSQGAADSDAPEIFPGTSKQLSSLSISLPDEDIQWCNTHGMRHSVELKDSDCEFPDVIKGETK